MTLTYVRADERTQRQLAKSTRRFATCRAVSYVTSTASIRHPGLSINPIGLMLGGACSSQQSVYAKGLLGETQLISTRGVGPRDTVKVRDSAER